jgi:GMP synthase-like glutamine amidotransferase
MKAALILQHGELGPPGILAEWAALRGIPVQIHRSDSGEPLPDVDGQQFVASLGSKYNPLDVDVPEVARELEFIHSVVAAGIPVLGLCYGGQMLAKVLGGEVEIAPEPEIGWSAVRTRAPELVAEGPWIQWHYARFTLPPGARLLAESPVALQAFSQGPHLGVQFHPESTLELALQWAHADTEQLRQRGMDGVALVESGRKHAARAREAAYMLFDRFWETARS